MKNTFSVGDKVTLTESMRRISTDPEKFRIGEVVRVGLWNIYDVQWNGVPYPIGMRRDEIVRSEAK